MHFAAFAGDPPFAVWESHPGSESYFPLMKTSIRPFLAAMVAWISCPAGMFGVSGFGGSSGISFASQSINNKTGTAAEPWALVALLNSTTVGVGANISIINNGANDPSAGKALLNLQGTSGVPGYASGAWLSIAIQNNSTSPWTSLEVELREDPGIPSPSSPDTDGLSFAAGAGLAYKALVGFTSDTAAPLAFPTVTHYDPSRDYLNFSGGTVGSGTRMTLLIPITDSSPQAAVYIRLTPNKTDPAPAKPVITVQPVSQTVNIGASVTFTVTATSTTPMSYQWKRSGVALPGATTSSLTFPGLTTINSGGYTVDVTNSVGTTSSDPAILRVTHRGAYFGTFGNQGLWAMQVRADDTGVFILHDRQANAAFSQAVSVKSDGAFSDDGTAGRAIAPGNARGAQLAGRIITGQVTGEFGAAKTAFTGSKDSDTGDGEPFAGYYFAAALGAGGGATYTVVGPSGRIALIAASENAADSLAGRISSLGQLISTTTNGSQIQVNLNGQLKSFEAIVRPSGIQAPIPISFLGLADGTLSSGRLTNLSILTALDGADDSFTMGYVVGNPGPTATKPLVIRAVGPSLAALGVGSPLADPKLELFVGANATGSNDNWGGGATLANAMAAVGAFPFLGPTSRDAAVAASVPTGPGVNHSVKVSPVGNIRGPVIAEVYDATPPATFAPTTPRLVNVSVLKHLGTGLTAGFVLGGTGPRTVLIRAIGPTLGAAPFNVPGVVADPQLALFAGTNQIAANDNWGGTPALTAAFAAVGAFGLPAASRDAAVLATLAPGNYSVQVDGVGNTTGLAIVEVYEVP